MGCLIEALEQRRCFGGWTMIAENVARGGIPFHTGPDSFVGADGGAFYVGYDTTHGSELWHARPGAAARLVKDVRPGKKSSSIELIGTLGPTVFFAADDGAAARSLWKSDGTSAGTVALRPIRAAGAGAALGGALYFTGDNGVHGAELWRTDGTRRGTVMLTDLRAGRGASAPRHLTVAGGRIFFTAVDDGNRTHLCATDGTKRGTVKLAGLVGGSYLDVARLGDTFVIGNDAHVWATDGASARNTHALGAHLTWRHLAAGPRTVLFAGPGERLWETNGTAAGTRAVAGLPAAFDKVVGIGQAFGGAAVHTGGNIDGEIWFTDGTPGNSRRLAAPRSSVFHVEHASFNDVHLFTHRGGYWQTDGTVAGSFLAPLGPDGALEGPLKLARDARQVLLLSGYTMGDKPPGEGYLRKFWSYVPAAAVGGFVFDDADGDGRLRADERRLSGFRVYADANGNGRFDAGERWTRTDVRGAYHLTQLDAGRHRIRVVRADGFSLPAAGWSVLLEPGEVVRRYLAMSDA